MALLYLIIVVVLATNFTLCQCDGEPATKNAGFRRVMLTLPFISIYCTKASINVHHHPRPKMHFDTLGVF